MPRSLRIATVLSIGVAAFVLMVEPAHAQRGRGRHVRVARPVVLVGGGYYRPFYRSYYYDPLFWGPYWAPHPFGWYPPYYYGVGAYDGASSVRVQVTPREAEVFVDGYFVGLVDDFDGFSQRLRLAPGEHEVELFLAGYRPIREKMLLRPGVDYKIRYTMEKLGENEPAPERPTPRDTPPSATGERSEPRSPALRGDGGPAGIFTPPLARGAAAEATGFGTLAIRVQPGDATVLVDGQVWEGPTGAERLTIELAAGTHQVEIRKDGHRTYSRTVDVRSGDVVNLNVSLPAQ